MCLEFSLWSFFEPSLDRFDFTDIADNLLQIWTVAGQIESNHEVQIVQNANEEDISPGQL